MYVRLRLLKGSRQQLRSWATGAAVQLLGAAGHLPGNRVRHGMDRGDNTNLWRVSLAATNAPIYGDIAPGYSAGFINLNCDSNVHCSSRSFPAAEDYRPYFKYCTHLSNCFQFLSEIISGRPFALNFCSRHKVPFSLLDNIVH